MKALQIVRIISRDSSLNLGEITLTAPVVVGQVSFDSLWRRRGGVYLSRRRRSIADNNEAVIAPLLQLDRSSEASMPAVVKLKAIEATPTSFEEFGQVIEASPDGDEFGPRDARLDLSRGIPRLYIMHLETRPLKFSAITHHASVTQCLGSIGGDDWYLGVAKSSILDLVTTKDFHGKKVVQSLCGHYYVPPVPDDVCVFRITGPKFLKLNLGTWHAGPLFLAEAMDFYNLELSNTNVVDHTTHDFSKVDGVVFLVDE